MADSAREIAPQIAEVLGVELRDVVFYLKPDEKAGGATGDEGIQLEGPLNKFVLGYVLGHELAHWLMLETPWSLLPYGTQEGVAKVASSQVTNYVWGAWSKELADPACLFWTQDDWAAQQEQGVWPYGPTSSWVRHIGLDRLREIAYASSDEADCAAALWAAIAELESP